MSAARKSPATKKLVHSSPESTIASGAKRVRLSKALAKIPKKPKEGSNRYKLPDNEYVQLTELKQRLMTLGIGVKRSELLRAGLVLLLAMGDVQLKKAVAKVVTPRAGRSPKKPG